MPVHDAADGLVMRSRRTRFYFLLVSTIFVLSVACGSSQPAEVAMTSDSTVLAASTTSPAPAPTRDSSTTSVSSSPSSSTELRNLNQRFLDGIDGLEYEGQLDVVPTYDSLGESGQARLSNELLFPWGQLVTLDHDWMMPLDGYSPTEYRFTCADGGFAQIFHFVWIYPAQREMWRGGNTSNRSGGFLPRNEPLIDGVFTDQDDNVTITTVERNLRGAGSNSELQTSAEYIQVRRVENSGADNISYAGWIATSITDDYGQSVEVLVTAPGRHYLRPGGIFDEDPGDIRELWDHPLIDARLNCAADAWQHIKPHVDAMQRSRQR